MIAQNKLPFSKREQLLIIIILTTALYFIGWNVAGKNLFDNLNSIHVEKNSLKDDQVELSNLIEEGMMLEKTFIKETYQREQLIDILPDLESLPLVLNKLESFLAEKPVTINSLHIGDTMYYDHYAAVYMKLIVNAEPLHLLDFLEQLENFPIIIYYDYLTWKNPPGPEVQMELQLQLLFYHPEQPTLSGGGST